MRRCPDAGLRALTLALGVLLAGPAVAQVPQQSPDLIGALLRLGLPHEAGWEARRLTVEGGPEALAPQTAYQVGLALALDGRPDEAAPFLTDAAAAAADPRQADQWELAAGVVLLRAHAVPRALHLFARVEEFGAEPGTRAVASRLKCVAQVLAADAAAARGCVPSWAAGGPQVQELLDGLDVNPHRRAIVGGVLSALLPGLGQATGGRPGEGGLALLVNGGLGAAVVFLLVDGDVAAASLVGLGVGLRYYLGNIEHGAAAWRTAAEQRRTRSAERLIRLLGSAPAPSR